MGGVSIWLRRAPANEIGGIMRETISSSVSFSILYSLLASLADVVAFRYVNILRLIMMSQTPSIPSQIWCRIMMTLKQLIKKYYLTIELIYKYTPSS